MSRHILLIGVVWSFPWTTTKLSMFDRMLRHVSGDRARDWSQGKVQGLLKMMGYDESQVWKF